MLNTDRIKQLRLTDGSEIICEVVHEWDEYDDFEEERGIIVRYALRIHKVDVDMYKSYYTFKPWMTYAEESDHLVTLNPDHVLGATIPAAAVMTQYEYVVGKIDGKIEDNDADKSYLEIMESVKKKLNMSEEELMVRKSGDSANNGDNVITLKFDRSKLH